MLSSSVDPLRPLLIYVLIVSTVAVTTDGHDKQGWKRPIKAAGTVSQLLYKWIPMMNTSFQKQDISHMMVRVEIRS